MSISISVNKDGEISILDEVKVSREYKGKSQLELIDDYVVIDLETTGLDPTWDEIIEIGAVKISDGKIVNQYNTLVKPINEIDDFISELTGITNDMLLDAPAITEVLPGFIDFIENSIVIGHNVNFDINFIYDNCISANNSPFKNDFIDTMRLSRWIFKDFKNHKLTTLIDNFKIQRNIMHRALSDSIATYECYEYIKQYIKLNNIDLKSIANRSKSYRPAKYITATVNVFDESHPVYEKSFVFTGTLEKLTRKEAMQLVVNLGGVCLDSINKKANFLVLGNNDYCSTIKDGKSSKQKKAEQLILAGYDITIISENVFYDMIG